MIDPAEERIQESSLPPRPSLTEPLDEFPLHPTNYWLGIWFLMLFASFVGVVVAVAADSPARGFVLLAMAASLGAYWVCTSLGRHRIHMDAAREILTHGPVGFQCRHFWHDIIGLQLLRIPPREGGGQASYQLNLV